MHKFRQQEKGNLIIVNAPSGSETGSYVSEGLGSRVVRDGLMGLGHVGMKVCYVANGGESRRETWPTPYPEPDFTTRKPSGISG